MNLLHKCTLSEEQDQYETLLWYFALASNSYQSGCFSVDRDSRCSGYISAQFVDLIHGL
jgi:hypothetical protein